MCKLVSDLVPARLLFAGAESRCNRLVLDHSLEEVAGINALAEASFESMVPVLRESIGREGRRLEAERFDQRRVLDRLMEIYASGT